MEIRDIGRVTVPLNIEDTVLKNQGARPGQKIVYDQSCPKLINNLKKRQLQGLIKQREKTVVTIFRLANTNLHQEDHEITKIYMYVQYYNGRK